MSNLNLKRLSNLPKVTCLAMNRADSNSGDVALEPWLCLRIVFSATVQYLFRE